MAYVMIFQDFTRSICIYVVEGAHHQIAFKKISELVKTP